MKYRVVLVDDSKYVWSKGPFSKAKAQEVEAIVLQTVMGNPQYRTLRNIDVKLVPVKTKKK